MIIRIANQMYCQIGLVNNWFTTICDVKHEIKIDQPHSIKTQFTYECESFDYYLQPFHFAIYLFSTSPKNMVIDRYKEYNTHSYIFFQTKQNYDSFYVSLIIHIHIYR